MGENSTSSQILRPNLNYGLGNGSSKHTQMNLWTDAKLEASILNPDHARVNEESFQNFVAFWEFGKLFVICYRL